MSPILSKIADEILKPLKKQSPDFQEICFLAARSAALRLAATNADRVALYIAHQCQGIFKHGVPPRFVTFVTACLVKEIEKAEKEMDGSPIFKNHEGSAEVSQEFIESLFKKPEGEAKNKGTVSATLKSFLDQADENYSQN